MQNTKQPWPKLKEVVVYDGYQTISQKTFLCPDSTEFTYDIVGRNHTVCTVAVTAENEFILAEQFRPGPEKYLLEIPAGRLELGEDPMKAAARELLEETGYQGEMELLHQSYFSAYSPRIRYCYLARNCRKVAEPHLESGEFVAVQLLSAEEFFTLVTAGGNTDTEAGFSALYRLGMLQKAS